MYRMTCRIGSVLAMFAVLNLSSESPAELSAGLGNGMMSNTRASESNTYGVRASIDYAWDRIPMAIEISGEGYIGKAMGRPRFLSTAMLYRLPVAEGGATASIGPTYGYAWRDRYEGPDLDRDRTIGFVVRLGLPMGGHWTFYALSQLKRVYGNEEAISAISGHWGAAYRLF